MKLLYLACPYSKGSARHRLARFHAVTVCAARLIEKRKIVFSPITMTHPIDLEMANSGETLGSDYWVAFDEAFMEKCDDFAILKLPGWDESSGVAREIEFFAKKGIAPKYLMPKDYCIVPGTPKFQAAFE